MYHYEIISYMDSVRKSRDESSNRNEYAKRKCIRILCARYLSEKGILQIYPVTIHMAPNTQPTMVITTASTCGAPTPTEVFQALLAKAGKVVANCCVGFGDPLIVMVGTLAAGEGGLEEGETFAARTEKRWEVACMIPCVELRKIRK